MTRRTRMTNRPWSGDDPVQTPRGPGEAREGCGRGQKRCGGSERGRGLDVFDEGPGRRETGDERVGKRQAGRQTERRREKKKAKHQTNSETSKQQTNIKQTSNKQQTTNSETRRGSRVEGNEAGPARACCLEERLPRGGDASHDRSRFV